MSLVTLLTDFGQGKYVAAMKGVLLSINPKATIVDIEHDITPQNVLEGAFVLASAVKYFPPAVHIAVVDPGVGTKRKPIVLECDRGLLVGPDNGLMMPAGRALGFRNAYEITRKDLQLPEVSDTFHGRDVFAPVGAHLSLGLSPREVGTLLERPVDLDFGKPRVTPSSVEGKILYRDRFGNLVTNVSKEVVPRWVTSGKAVELQAAGVHRLVFRKAYRPGKEGKLLLTFSSDGYLEIAVTQGDASSLLGFRGPNDFVLRKAR